MDDHTLHKSFRPMKNFTSEDQARTQIENTLDNVGTWIDSNRLKMNAAKTEFLMIGTQQQLFIH